MSSFDEKAATWDDEGRIERARVLAAAVRRAVALTGSTRLFEYGAGTGLVSQELAPGVGAITLADPSAGMREVMQDKVAKGTLPATTRVWDLDLSAGSVPDEHFDVVVTVMALHHIPDLTPVFDGFARLLDDRGHLCVIDLVQEDGSFHDDPDFHGHHGFDTRDLSVKLEAAGFTDVRVEQIYEVAKAGATYPLFLATCTKPARP
ncbi:class I SAM-dependent methyltransferase [Amycolatopsis pigmentata]|uniref:Class I SAM-dependent methyltransferase n=1 Tax=Amycolatopsis pigmentata TaxID=450801 RepID=A0ABW5FP62_9PSEU